jgi:hypothetical protein
MSQMWTSWAPSTPVQPSTMERLEDVEYGLGGEYSPEAYDAAGDGVTDDTDPLSDALTDMDNAGYGVLDLGGKTYLTGKLSLKPGLGIVNGALKLKGSTNDYVIDLVGHATRAQRDWRLENLVIDGNKGSNSSMPGVIQCHATGYQFDRPLIRNVRIGNAKGKIIKLSSSSPSSIYIIQPRLQYITIDCSEIASGTSGLSLEAGVYDLSASFVDIGRCYVGVDISSTIKHRFTDVRAWGCQDLGLKIVDSARVTFSNSEFDNNLGHGAYIYNSTIVHFVDSAFTNSAYVDVANDFGYGVNYNLAAANTKDGAVLDQNSRAYFTACRFGNEEAVTSSRGEQRYGVSSGGGAQSIISADCVFENHRTGEVSGPTSRQYIESGALKYIGTSGTITTLGNA